MRQKIAPWLYLGMSPPLLTIVFVVLLRVRSMCLAAPVSLLSALLVVAALALVVLAPHRLADSLVHLAQPEVVLTSPRMIEGSHCTL